MERTNVIDSVITTDSDFLVHGCKHVYILLALKDRVTFRASTGDAIFHFSCAALASATDSNNNNII